MLYVNYGLRKDGKEAHLIRISGPVYVIGCCYYSC